MIITKDSGVIVDDYGGDKNNDSCADNNDMVMIIVIIELQVFNYNFFCHSNTDIDIKCL